MIEYNMINDMFSALIVKEQHISKMKNNLMNTGKTDKFNQFKHAAIQKDIDIEPLKLKPAPIKTFKGPILSKIHFTNVF